jgi:hypothetical protein
MVGVESLYVRYRILCPAPHTSRFLLFFLLVKPLGQLASLVSNRLDFLS